MSIITTDLVALDVDAGGDKEAVIGLLADRLAAAGRATDRDGLIAAAMAREAQSATGLPGGIAIPHCRSPHVDEATIGFARLSPPVDFGAPDGPADLAFLIAAPESGGVRAHEAAVEPGPRAGAQGVRRVAAQRRVGRRGGRPGRGRGQSRSRGRARQGCRPPSPRPRRRRRRRSSPSPRAPPASPTPTWRPTHWSLAAKKAGVTLHVETQGSSGSTPLSAETIAAADRRHLRHRRRREGPRAVRGQARHRLGREARHQRARQDGGRSARRRNESQRGARRGRRRRTGLVVQPVRLRRRRLGHPHPADPAHRRQLHDPVRRRGRPAHRARLPARPATTSPIRPTERSRWRSATSSPRHTTR